MSAKKDRYRSTAVKFENAFGKWDSKGEFNRYIYLKDLESKGVISDLIVKKRYDFDFNGVKISYFTPDFTYKIKGVLYTEDFKGAPPSDPFKMRVKMLKAFYDLDCFVVYDVTDFRYIARALK